MSGMDTGNTLRSQEFVQRSEMQSQSLRQDSANQMTGGLRQSVEFMKQFAMLKAESDARLQMQQQEMALNQLKLQHMQALDMADMSGEQVKAARLQNQAMELEIEEAKRRKEAYGKSDYDELQMKVITSPNALENMLRMGRRPKKGGGFEDIPKDEHDKILQSLNSGGNRSNQLRLLAEYFEMQGDPDAAEELTSRIREAEGLQAPKPKVPPQATQPPPPDPKLQAEYAPARRALSAVVPDPKEQDRIVQLLNSKAKDIAAALDASRSDNKSGKFTEKEAFDWAIEALSNPSHPKHEFAKNYLKAIGGPWIGVVGHMSRAMGY